MEINYLPTADQVADFLTKSLYAPTFNRHREATMGDAKLQLHFGE